MRNLILKQLGAVRALFFGDHPLVILAPPDHALGAFQEFWTARVRAHFLP